MLVRGRGARPMRVDQDQAGPLNLAFADIPSRSPPRTSQRRLANEETLIGFSESVNQTIRKHCLTFFVSRF